MASRDGLAEPEAVGNSNTFLWAGQIAVSYGSQLFMRFGALFANCSGSNHRILKPLRQNLGLVFSFVHAQPQLPKRTGAEGIFTMKIFELRFFFSVFSDFLSSIPGLSLS